jgi:2,4-dienoyl-CoA reductase-like NADH-dependent reductase (Old Yellow Enzyme family)
VFTEAAAVSPQARITPYDLGIYKDDHISFLRRVTDFILEQGSIAGIQLAHAGRKASHHRPWDGHAALAPAEGAWITEAPSPVAYKASEPLPLELSSEAIQHTIADFRKAALRAKEAGFGVIEIHAAHGYLLHEFLSPLSNWRTDAYGGSFENRTRIVREITRAIREVCGETLPLFVRISATDWVDGGWTIDDSVALSILLKEDGADLIDCSSGGNAAAQKIPVGPLYQTHFAERIKREAGILTGAVGMITTPEEAEGILREGRADLVFLARQLLRDPYFPLRAAKTLQHDLPWPAQYERGRM